MVGPLVVERSSRKGWDEQIHAPDRDRANLRNVFSDNKARSRSEQLKKVYLIGVANAIQVETAYHAANPPSDGQSIVPRFVKGLKGQTLDSVRDGLDSWYAAHPDKLQRPVIETIWFEMVVPGLQKNK